MERREILKYIVETFMNNTPAYRRLFITSYKEGQKLTSQECLTLNALANGQKIQMHKLSSILGISKQQTTRLVDGLVKGGYLEREMNPESRREILVCINEAGLKKLSEIAEAKLECLEQIFSDKDDQELEAYIAHADAMKSIFDKATELSTTKSN